MKAKQKQKQKITLRKVGWNAVALISLACMYLLILVPFVPYAVMRGLTDDVYLADWENHIFDFVECIINKFRKK